MSPLSLIIAMLVMFALICVAVFKDKGNKGKDNSSQKPDPEVYWTENRYLNCNGQPLNIYAMSTPGIAVDPEGHTYYVASSSVGKFKVVKDWNDLYEKDSDTFEDMIRGGAGGGYYFYEIEKERRRDLFLRRISDTGQVDTFTLHRGKGEFDYYVNWVSADAKGNAYVAGKIKNVDGLNQPVLWVVTVEGKVSRINFNATKQETDCAYVATCGDDVYALVNEGYVITDNEGNADYLLALYKNGQRQYLVTNDLNWSSSRYCCISVVGKDLYVGVCEGEPKHQKIKVYKNGKEHSVIENENVGLLIISLFVTKSGNVYVSGSEFNTKNKYYIWKNGKVIANPESYPDSLYVKE